MPATKSQWKVIGATRNGGPAEAGSQRIYYQNTVTGKWCWRAASWGDHGCGSHGFRDYGPGHGYDPETDAFTKDRYPESEF